MVKPNIFIYPLPFITREKLGNFSLKLRQLESQTETDIFFDHDKQCFSIEGNTQDGCDQAEKIITHELLPLFNKFIDESCMNGTYEDLSYFKVKTSPANVNIVNVTGRSLGNQHEEDDEVDDEEEIGIREEPRDLPIIIKEFSISPKVTNIADFLIGPPQFNMQLAEYMNIIPKMTKTDCILKGRTIVITGEEHCVDNAIDKFNVIQKSYIAHLKVDYAICIHNPNISGHYDLCFCDLNMYRHKSFVKDQLGLQQHLTDIHIILPVFLDLVTGQYVQPKDFINNSLNNISKEYQKEKTKQKQKQLNETFDVLNTRNTFNNNNLSLSLQPKPVIVSNPKECIYITPYNKTADKMSNIANTFREIQSHTVIDEPQLPELPLSVYQYEVKELPQNNITNFPELPKSIKPNDDRSKALFKPTMNNEKPKTRRVLRIIPQKSSSPSSKSSASLVDRVKKNNYHKIKTVLERGLDSLRGFKGDITLSAKIGKVLWTDIPTDMKRQIWKHEDIDDILVKEHLINPEFTKITATDEHILECMTSENVLPTPAFSKTSTYEFHCSARNQPTLPFRPVVIHMNQGVIDVKKVVLREKSIAKVDWISLDRKYDFQFSLSTKVLARTNVKPYTTFINRVSICPITRLMTFENVPKFLTVKYILLKETAKFRIAYPFIIEITRVEKVPIKPVANTVKIIAHPGEGEEWYDFEIKNTKNDMTFEKNKNLEIGEEALWTAKDILGLADGDKGTADMLTEYVKNILIFIEKIEREMQE